MAALVVGGERWKLMTGYNDLVRTLKTGLLFVFGVESLMSATNIQKYSD